MARANQQIIADRLGISKATVSRCFTNHAGINPATRAKVFQVAAEIGYHHLESRSRANLSHRKKNPLSFSVLICSETEEYHRTDYRSPGEELLAGVSEFTQTNKIQLDVDFVSPTITSTTDPLFKKIQSLRSRKNRGIILIYPFADSLVKELSGRFPIVSLVDQVKHESLDCVDVDHHSGISKMIDHLVEMGHERIGFYTRDYAIEASWSFRRYSAFLEKMARLKKEVRQEDILGIYPNTFQGIEDSMSQAIKQTNAGVTAWICAADHQAYDLIKALQLNGMNVPEDVSVTGFDGIQQKPGDLQLTTIEIPFHSIGLTGAERLAKRIKKRFGGRQTISISGNLKIGNSVSKRS